MEPLTAYEVSRWTGRTINGARELRYDVRNRIHIAPPTSATYRSPRAQREVSAHEFVDVLYEPRDGKATFPLRPVQPVPLVSGKRTLLGVLRNTRTENYYASFRCSCGQTGRIGLGSWRAAVPDAGCRECSKRNKAEAMNKWTGAKASEARERAALQGNPLASVSVAGAWSRR